jgi:hypothetical protein
MHLLLLHQTLMEVNMPYPDNFSSSAYDRHMSSPEEVLPSDAKDVYEAQDALRAIVRASVVILKDHGFKHISTDDLEASFYGIEDTLGQIVGRQVDALQERGFDLSIRGDDFKGFIENQADVLKGGVA